MIGELLSVSSPFLNN